MFTYLESLKLEKTSFSKRLFKTLLAPIWFIMEYFCFKKYWKIILSELIENDKIFDFLDKNEFSIKNNRLIKKDLVDDNEFLRGRSLEECKHIIRKEYSEAFVDLFSKYCNINIAEIITLFVVVEPFLDETTLKRANVFEVDLYYSRLPFYESAKKSFKTWCLIFSIILIIIFSIIFFIF